MQGRAVVDLEAAEEAERRAHGNAALGAGVLVGRAAELLALCDVGEGRVRLEHGTQEVDGGRPLGERMQHARTVPQTAQHLVAIPLLGAMLGDEVLAV